MKNITLTLENFQRLCLKSALTGRPLDELANEMLAEGLKDVPSRTEPRLPTREERADMSVLELVQAESHLIRPHMRWSTIFD